MKRLPLLVLVLAPAAMLPAAPGAGAADSTSAAEPALSTPVEAGPAAGALGTAVVAAVTPGPGAEAVTVSGGVGSTSACCESGPCFGWGSYTVSCCGNTCSASGVGVTCDGWPTWCPDPCAGNGICNSICQNDPDCPNQCVQGASCSDDDDCRPHGNCWGGSCDCPE